ncbi:MAG: HNH endonuclease signature motif containing protein [Bdellovibrionota bacterium]
MNLSQLASSELLLRLEKLSRTERKITHVILWHILEVEIRKLYADRGYGSCFEYLTKGLGYSEGSAYRRLQSARLLKKMPEKLSASIAVKLENGSLNLSQLTQVQKCLKHEENLKKQNRQTESTEHILELIENRNTFETQKILAKQFNQPVQTAEKIISQRNDSVKVEIILTKEQMKNLEQAQSLLSHVCPDGSISALVDYLVIQHILKSKKKTNINACCEYIDPVTARKCDSNYQLQKDHIIPKAKGGGDDPSNLRTLCRSHNLSEARRWGLLD